MPECHKCGKDVYVSDGMDFAEGVDACWECEIAALESENARLRAELAKAHRFITLTSIGNEKIRLRVDTILGVRPCGTAAYGANVDVSLAVQIVQVNESPDQVWELMQRGPTLAEALAKAGSTGKE